jgi:type VI protein secretion system component VasK
MVPASSLNGPVWAFSVAMSVITLGGLSLLFVLVIQLIKRGGDISPATGIMMLSILALIALVDLMLAWQLSRVIGLQRAQAAPPERPRPEPAPRPELAERQPARLDAPREPYISVTENTTRTLDAVARERDTRPQS